MSLEDFVTAMPKVELHVHLEGAIEPATLLKLARRRGVTLPCDDEAGLRDWFRFRDFEHFVEIYLTCSKCLRDPEDFQIVVLDFLAEQARQNIVYSEVHFTISTHAANGCNVEEVGDALAGAIAEGESRHGVRMRLIPDIVRNVGAKPADLALEWALAWQGKTVVGLGLSGSEARFPAEPFAEHFREAENRGLRRTAHAGEHAGAASVREALSLCRAERIGHGVTAIDDLGLVEELAARKIPLEICPTSNHCLGVVADLSQHPFDRLRRAGVEVTVNSDDPALFNTTLSREYLRLHEVFGYGPEELAELARTALRHAFLSDGEKEAWGREFEQQSVELGELFLG